MTLRKGALVAFAVFTALIATISCDASTTNDAGSQPGGPAMWSGSTYTYLNRSDEMLGAGYTARGDFWFRVDKHGNVAGHAVVVYQPTSDVTGINQRITLAKDVTGAALGLVLPSGGLLGPAVGLLKDESLASIVGLQITWKDPMPHREGAITGSLRNGHLDVRWADGAQPGLQAVATLVYLQKKSVLATPTMSIATPWPGTATVSEQDGQLLAEANSGPQNETDSGVTSSMSSYWYAHPSP